MKKLKLSDLNLGNAEVLTREQLKKVLGGMGSDGSGSGSGSGVDYSCSVECKPGYFACCNNNVLAPDCYCEVDGTPQQCDDGGPGSSKCSATQTV